MTIGVDLGGSHVLATTVDDSGAIKKRFDVDVEDRSFEAVLKTIVAAVKNVCEQSKETPSAIGLGSPGNVDPASGTIRYSPNFGWHDAPLGLRLREEFDMPVFVANDARCATLGEHAYGVGAGTANFVLLTLGTGIGGGIIAAGNLLIGDTSGAGEFGHHQIRATDGFICGCGKTGCFEAQASGTGLLRHALALAPSFPRSTLVGGKPEKLSAKAVRKAAEAGDGHALAAWHAFTEDLSCGLANVIAFVNPEMIALGGGVSSAGDFLLDAVRPRVDVLTTMVPRGTTKIVQASLGNDAGAIGAATMARRGGLTAKEPVAT
jgi:glucokinase